VFRQSHASQLIPKAAYTPTFADWFRTHRQWGTAPRPGAVVFFDFPNDGVNRISHVGLVEAVNGDGTIQTIEGNTTGPQHADDGVWRRTRRVGVVGYGYPAYEVNSTGGTNGAAPVAPVAAPVDTVRRTQAAVHVAVDGQWGPITDRAVSLVRSAARGGLGDVRALQGAWNVTVDGDWGPKTDAAWRTCAGASERGSSRVPRAGSPGPVRGGSGLRGAVPAPHEAPVRPVRSEVGHHRAQDHGGDEDDGEGQVDLHVTDAHRRQCPSHRADHRLGDAMGDLPGARDAATPGGQYRRPVQHGPHHECDQEQQQDQAEQGTDDGHPTTMPA
jgi:hypothetical protein